MFWSWPVRLDEALRFLDATPIEVALFERVRYTGQTGNAMRATGQPRACDSSVQRGRGHRAATMALLPAVETDDIAGGYYRRLEAQGRNRTLYGGEILALAPPRRWSQYARALMHCQFEADASSETGSSPLVRISN